MWQRVRSALKTWPTPGAWRLTTVVTLGFASVALAVGLSSGLLSPQLTTAPLLPLLLRSLVVPSIVEELVFRVLPPPRFALPALALYVLYHPLNAFLFFPAARAVFYDPVFLLLAALLGGCCTLLYRRTGSVWPAVLLHWLSVAGWLVLLGGEAALRPA